MHTDPTAILTELVAFDILGGQPNLPIITWIEDYLRPHGIAATRVYNEDRSKAALHCRIGPPTDGGIILSGHTDVVPVTGQAWTTAPFGLTQRAGRLYGRGSCDMKGFLACCLSTVPYFSQLNLRKPLYLAFSFDEEIGCRSGRLTAEAIRGHYGEKPAGAIIGEPTMMRPVIGQKGIGVHTTTVHGSQGHSSRIREEVDAVQEAARLIVWLEDQMEALIAAGRLDDRFSPDHTTIHTGRITGGSAFNIIANECSFDWEFRNLPQDSATQIVANFKAYCDGRVEAGKARYPDYKIEHHSWHPPVPPLDTPADAPITTLIKQLTEIAETTTVAYAAEAGQFAQAGFPAVICGPGDIAQAHRADEFVSLIQLGECCRVLRRLGDWLTS